MDVDMDAKSDDGGDCDSVCNSNGDGNWLSKQNKA
jgi:hypothetical protein